VRIYDGDSQNDEQLGKFCGTARPDHVNSRDNKVLILFRTDDRGSRKGFKLSWRQVPKKTGVSTTESTTTEAQGGTAY